MFNRLVSVIIPTYNRAALIKRAVDSVLNQSHKNIELIVVDDGSTDSTLDVLSSIGDLRLNVIKTEGRKGANFARNLGVSHARGDLIGFQDSDDEWLFGKLAQQLDLMQEKQADAVITSFLRVVDDSVRYYPFKVNRDSINRDEGLVKTENCLRSNVLSTQTLLIKKEVFNELKGFDNSLKRLQDWDLAIRLIDNYKVYLLDCPLVNVYEQSDSISVNTRAALESRKVFLSKFAKIYKRYPKVKRFILYDYYKLKYKYALGLVK